MQDADLMKHLSCIKDYYFLGRGELFLEFIKLGSKILNELPSGNPNGTRDINVAFILAARNMFIGKCLVIHTGCIQNVTESFFCIVNV